MQRWRKCAAADHVVDLDTPLLFVVLFLSFSLSLSLSLSPAHIHSVCMAVAAAVAAYTNYERQQHMSCGKYNRLQRIYTINYSRCCNAGWNLGRRWSFSSRPTGSRDILQLAVAGRLAAEAAAQAIRAEGRDCSQLQRRSRVCVNLHRKLYMRRKGKRTLQRDALRWSIQYHL